MKMPVLPTLLLASLLGTTAILVAPSNSDACGNTVYLNTDEATKQVAAAEKMLRQGKYGAALDLVDRYRYKIENKNLERRATLVRATAFLRKTPNWAGKDQLKRERRDLAKLYEATPNDPVVAARYAESLLDDSKAMPILDDLVKRDLMPDAHAYATLARLRHRAKDIKGSDEAFARCRPMSKRADHVCLLKEKIRKDHNRGVKFKHNRSRSRSRQLRTMD